MDGNGRWALQRGLTRIEGHRRGKDSVRAVVETSRRLGIEYLSLFAFSTENWSRSPDEVRFLMGFNESLLLRRVDELDDRDVRAQVTADVDFSLTEQTSEQHRPNQGNNEAAVRSTQIIEAGSAADQAPAGVPGAVANREGSGGMGVLGEAAVTGVEAGPKTVRLARRNLAANGFPGVKVLKGAVVAAGKGKVEFAMEQEVTA